MDWPGQQAGASSCLNQTGRSGKIREDRSEQSRSEAGGQSATLSQGFCNPLKKLSVAGDEAVRDAGASPQITSPVKQKSLS